MESMVRQHSKRSSCVEKDERNFSNKGDTLILTNRIIIIQIKTTV